jgi:hypothetical protein
LKHSATAKSQRSNISESIANSIQLSHVNDAFPLNLTSSINLRYNPNTNNQATIPRMPIVESARLQIVTAAPVCKLVLLGREVVELACVVTAVMVVLVLIPAYGVGVANMLVAAELPVFALTGVDDCGVGNEAGGSCAEEGVGVLALSGGAP